MQLETRSYLDHNLTEKITKNQKTPEEIIRKEHMLKNSISQIIEHLGKTPYINTQQKQEYLNTAYNLHNVNLLEGFQDRLATLYKKCQTHDKLLKINNVFYDAYGNSFEEFIIKIPDIDNKIKTLHDNTEKLPGWIAKENTWLSKLKVMKEITPAIYSEFMFNFWENIANQEAIYKDEYLKTLVEKHEDLIKNYKTAIQGCSFFKEKDIKGFINWFKKLKSFQEMGKEYDNMKNIVKNLDKNKAKVFALVKPSKHLCSAEKKDILEEFKTINLQNQETYIGIIEYKLEKHKKFTEKYQEKLTHEEQAKYDPEFFELSYFEKEKFLNNFEFRRKEQENNLENSYLVEIETKTAAEEQPPLANLNIKDASYYQYKSSEEQFKNSIEEQIAEERGKIESLILWRELNDRIERNENLTDGASTAQKRAEKQARSAEELSIIREYNETTNETEEYLYADGEAQKVENINTSKLQDNQKMVAELDYRLQYEEEQAKSKQSIFEINIVGDSGEVKASKEARRAEWEKNVIWELEKALGRPSTPHERLCFIDALEQQTEKTYH